MASDDPRSVFVFGEKNDTDTLGITNGPNEWDLWLCLRGTHAAVSFGLDRETTFPNLHPNNRRSFLEAKITGISRDPGSFVGKFILTGYTSCYRGSRYFFEMDYNAGSPRGGSVRFLDPTKSPSRDIFVVVVEPSNGGHGPWSAPILTTYNGVKAVETARSAESLGFDINWKESQVAVFLMAPEKVYTRQFFKREDSSNPIVYKKCRGTSSDGKETRDEYFFGVELAAAFDMTQALDGPSKPIQG